MGALDPGARSIFNKAVYRGVQQRRLADRDEKGMPGQMDRIVRLAGSSAIVIRERGDRTLEEIPPSESASVLIALAGPSGLLRDNAEALFAELLKCYELERAPDSDWQTRILHQALEWAVSGRTIDALNVQRPLFPTHVDSLENID
jgi:hypothetical protein